jgi:hypothetical protein
VEAFDGVEGCVSGAVVGGGVVADRATSGWFELGWFAEGLEVTGAPDVGFGDSETVFGMCAEVIGAGSCGVFAGARGVALSGRGCSRGWSAREWSTGGCPARDLSGVELGAFAATSGIGCAARPGGVSFELEELTSGVAACAGGTATEFGFGICCCAGMSGAAVAVFSAPSEMDGAVADGLLVSTVFLSNMCSIWFRVAGPAANHPATNDAADAIATMAKTFPQLLR